MEIVVYRTRFATETLVDDTAAVLALYSNFDAILFFFFFFSSTPVVHSREEGVCAFRRPLSDSRQFLSGRRCVLASISSNHCCALQKQMVRKNEQKAILARVLRRNFGNGPSSASNSG